ncbi:MAG: AbrB/MazE/SpoVT family DNA-binding domain-containing protein [Armatimonadetes bacterium]|nr:AbrB/MazE/SpoVT family DNA-binding domain-containing protein [Armatimonadota bacterium]
MTAVRVKDKAQITLPARVRRALGIKEGDVLRVSLEHGRVVLTPQATLDDLPEVELTPEGKRLLQESLQAEGEGRTREFSDMKSLVAGLKREAGLD